MIVSFCRNSVIYKFHPILYDQVCIKLALVTEAF